MSYFGDNFTDKKKKITVGISTYIILSMPCIILIPLSLIHFILHRMDGLLLLFLTLTELGILFNLSQIRIEIYEDVILYASFWRSKRVALADLIDARIEYVTPRYRDRFKLTPFYQLILTSKSKSQLVINAKLFSKSDLNWIMAFLSTQIKVRKED